MSNVTDFHTKNAPVPSGVWVRWYGDRPEGAFGSTPEVHTHANEYARLLGFPETPFREPAHYGLSLGRDGAYRRGFGGPFVQVVVQDERGVRVAVIPASRLSVV